MAQEAAERGEGLLCTLVIAIEHKLGGGVVVQGWCFECSKLCLLGGAEASGQVLY